MQRVKFLTLGIVGIVGVVWGAASASANVSLRNGNFFIGYTDIIYPGGFEPKIERVYNSKTAYYGMFGHGWGNEYEAYLVISADGSVVLHEYGGGAENRFFPVKANPKEFNEAIELLTKTALAAGALSSQGQVQKYQASLRSDATFRNDEWLRFIKQGKLKPKTLPIGTQLASNRFSYQYITKTKDGYVRAFDNGRLETFNDAGKLVRISDRNGNFIALAYSPNGLLTTIADSLNRKMTLSYNSAGRVSRIDGENGKVAVFTYNAENELTYSKDVDGNEYWFAYSPDRRHNLTEVKYSDKTTLQVAYHPKDQNENVKSIKDRDGTLTEYSYRYASADKNNFTVMLRVKTKEGQELSTSSYDYALKTSANGEKWTQRLVTTIDGERTETEYNEAFGLPVSIKRGTSLTRFGYDAKGRVVMKDSPSEKTELKYHSQWGKVVRVARTLKRAKKSTWAEFTYDGKGNLESAKNSDNKFARLVYNSSGQIVRMVDHNKRVLQLKYNENSKPIEITDPALGSVKVSYTNSGEVKDVQSTAPRNVAQQVTVAFQSLLELVRSAGVTLTPN